MEKNVNHQLGYRLVYSSEKRKAVVLVALYRTKRKRVAIETCTPFELGVQKAIKTFRENKESTVKTLQNG